MLYNVTAGDNWGQNLGKIREIMLNIKKMRMKTVKRILAVKTFNKLHLNNF